MLLPSTHFSSRQAGHICAHLYEGRKFGREAGWRWSEDASIQRFEDSVKYGLKLVTIFYLIFFIHLPFKLTVICVLNLS